MSTGRKKLQRPARTGRPPARTSAASAGRSAGVRYPALLEPVSRPVIETVLIICAAVAFQALAWSILIRYLNSEAPWRYRFFDVSDVETTYFPYAQKIAAGLRVYKDFSFEYPPLALPLITMPPHGGDLLTYMHWFRAEMILITSIAAALTGATAASLWHGLRRPLAAAAAFAVAVLAAGAITANRYDVAVALTLAACLFFLARRHTAAAGAALGVGVALKLTPGLLLPLVLIVAETRRRVLYALVAWLVFAATPFLPFLGRFSGLTYVLTFNTQRPLQVESVPATAYLLAGAQDAWGVGIEYAYNSWSIFGPGSVVVARVSVWIGLLLVAGVYLLLWQRRALLRAAPQYIPVAALACVLVFTVCNKVLSPQYMCWLLPLVALVVVGDGRWQRVTGVLTLVAIALTQVEFPKWLGPLLALEPQPVYVVAARNLVLVAATITAVAAVWRLPERATQA